MKESEIDMEVFEAYFDKVMGNRRGLVRAKIAEVLGYRDEYDTVLADSLLRHAKRVERSIVGWRQLAKMPGCPKAERELIGHLLEELEFDLRVFRSFALSLTPRRARA